MTSHELARRLLSLPDMPVATYAKGYAYKSSTDASTHGPLALGRLEDTNGRGVDHLVIGNFNRRLNENSSGWRVYDIYESSGGNL